MTDRKDPIERAIEVVVYAPLGLGLILKDMAPTLLDSALARGRAEVDRRHEQLAEAVTTARSTGQVAMSFGFPKVRARVERKFNEVRGRYVGSGGAPQVRPAPRPPRPASTPAREVRVDVGGNGGPVSGDLPIPGYDALSASQVVERLLGLGPDELEAVRAYEASHRNRRTILGKIEQLAS